MVQIERGEKAAMKKQLGRGIVYCTAEELPLKAEQMTEIIRLHMLA